MKVLGIVAEYNPFHNGHLHHIREAKKLSGANYCVVVMSGNYVQRGEPAIFHKSLRTQMALQNGADLVVALPAAYSTGTAEVFATAAVSILNTLQADYICFGTESGNLELLQSIADILAKEPADFQAALAKELSRKTSFPRARSKALAAYATNTGISRLSTESLESVMSSPNNILGIEYLKAMIRSQSPMTPIAIRRMGQGYHEECCIPTEMYASATGIRNNIKNKEAFDLYIPKSCQDILSSAGDAALPVYLDDFSYMLNYSLVSHNTFDEYADINEELSYAICANKGSFRSFHEWTELLTNKTYPASRVRRGLLHIMLGIRKELYTPSAGNSSMNRYYALDSGKPCNNITNEEQKASFVGDSFGGSCSLYDVPYIQILGINPSVSSASIKEAVLSAGVPLLSRPADGNRLTGRAAAIFQSEIRCEDIYRLAYFQKYGILCKTEQEQKIQRFPAP